MEKKTKMKIKFVRRHNEAVIPSRANPTDIGLDLVAIKEHKVLPSGVVLFDTGIAVTPPEGYYIEILPRSSMSKSGWILANCVGTIDPLYTGNLFIALARVNHEAPAPELPFCLCQMVLRKAEYADMEEVKELDDTERGDGGFGSTGQRTGNE